MPANPLPLSERIHQACPCADIEQGYGSCDIGCKCDPSPQHPQAPPTDCKWEGHAIAGEVEAQGNVALGDMLDSLQREVAALTAKVEEGHTRSCVCLYGDEYVDPRCVEWRRK